jgi:hypothetical protein
MKYTVKIALGFVFLSSTLLIVSAAEGQAMAATQDQSSLADYARKVNKSTGGAKAKPKVFDNDNLPKDDKLSVVGQEKAGEASTENRTAPDEKTPAVPKAAAKDNATKDNGTKDTAPEDQQAKKQAEWKGWQQKIASQNDQISLASRELDVTQREYQLRAAAMYADAGNRLRNATQWDKEEANYKQQLADKQKALDEAKQKLADMKEEAFKAGVPSSMVE